MPTIYALEIGVVIGVGLSAFLMCLAVSFFGLAKAFQVLVK